MEQLDKPQIICHLEKDVNYSVHEVKWIPSSAKFVAMGGKSNGTGIVEIYNMSTDGFEKISEFAKADQFKCGTFEASSLRTKTFSYGRLWRKITSMVCTQVLQLSCILTINISIIMQNRDLEDPLLPVYKSTKHSAIINSIDGVAGTKIGCGAPEIVTGSRDGSVMVWDVRQKDTPVAKFLPNEGTAARDCWTVAFGNSYNSEERIVCAGYDNGDVKMFDLKSMSLRWSKCLKNGVVGLQFDRKDIPMNKLVATTLESKLYCFDVRTQHPRKGFAQVTEKAHSSTIWSVKHLPQNREIFMTTGGAGSLCLWKYNYPDKRVDKDGDGIEMGVPGDLSLLQNSTVSTQPITSFDWCNDKIGLSVSSSYDQTVRVLITTKLNLY